MHILRQVPWARHSRCRIGTRPIWVLLASSTFYALALLCFQSISHRDPSSVFFDASRAYNPLYSAHRAAQAESYITSINQSGRHVVNNNEPPLLCLGIATVARRGTQYVRNTVGSFFAGLSEEERDLIFFDLFVAHSDPAKHPIFAEHWLDVLPDRILQYPKDIAEFDQVRAWEEGGWYRNKSIYDYRYLLRDCYDTGAHYVAMVENDTLAVQGWFGRLLDALATVKVKMNGHPPDQRWLYLRLFYTDELLGWNSEQWATYLFWSFVVWISLLTMMLVTRRRFPTQLEFLTDDVVAAIAFVCIPAMVLLFFLAGKQTMMPLPSGVQEMNKYGCCSQGFVFPRDMVPDVLNKLRIETKGLVDMQIEKIADAGGYVRWAVVPPILQHSGGTSSKGYGFDDNARRTWSFRFEQYPYD